MSRFLLRRLGHAATVILVVCTATFALVHLAPGGPALLADPKLSVEEQQAIAQRLGLDRPLPEQYARWLAAAARGDLGQSFLYQAPTLETILARLPNTALLAGAALALSLLAGVPLGLLCAARPGGVLDRTLSGAAFLAMAIPTFWLAIGAIFVFAIVFQVLPAGGAATVGTDPSFIDRVRHLVLPATVLAAVTTAELLRYTRSAARTAFDQPFVRMARAKGTGDRRVHWHHVLRNTLVPVVTAIGIQLPRLVGGAAITESVFAWPGMGRLGVQAALGRDYPLVMGITLIVSVAVVTINIAIDLVYAWIDPRIRVE